MFCVWNILELAKRHEAPATRKAYAQKNSSTQLQTDSKRQRLQMWRDVKRRFFPNGQTIAAKYGQIARMQSNFAIHCCKVCILWQFKDV